MYVEMGRVGTKWLVAAPSPATGRLHPVHRPVAQHRPALRGGHREGERALEIRLFEVGEDPAGVGRLVLGVEVDLAVLRVHEAVQALAGPAVGTLRVHHQLVLGGEAVQRDPGAVEDRRRVQLPPVEPHRGHRGGQQIGEGRRARLGAAEADRGRGAEGARPGPGVLTDRGPQIERHLVTLDGQQLRPRTGLVTGQVLTGHDAAPSAMSRISDIGQRKSCHGAPTAGIGEWAPSRPRWVR